MFSFVQLDPQCVWSPMWPHPTPKDFDFNECDPTQSEVASTKVTAFFKRIVFKNKIFKEFFLYISN